MPISIAIPFYNAEKYLAGAIRSVFAQTYQEWELILIDDGSTDNSLKIAQSVDDPRVRVISDGINKKLAERLNEITNLANYDYIARMDADDLMSPMRLEIQFNILKDDPEVDVVSTGMFSISNYNKLLGYRGSDFDNISFEQLIRKERGILHASLLARKSWYVRNKYNPSIPTGQDVDLWLRSSKNQDLKIKSISNPLYLYREEINVSLKKMLRAYKVEREHYSKYIDDKLYKYYFLINSLLKSFIICFMDKLGLLKLLLKRRNNSKISTECLNEYSKILLVINNTKVPGID